MSVSMNKRAAIIYLFTQSLTKLASTAFCIFEDASLSLCHSQPV